METAASQPTLIVTIMAGDPAPDVQLTDFAKSLHTRWELVRDAVRVRRAEDVVACQILGADHLHWSVPDCIYRTDPATGEACYPTWESVITTQHPADTAVLTWLTQQLAQLPAADRVYAPLAAGGHVDHRLVRQAAGQVFGNGLWYYEDYPYAEEPGAVTAVFTPSTSIWQPHTTSLSPSALQARLDAIWAYASQRSTFFAQREDMDAKITSYTSQIGGERYWQTAVPSK